MTLFRAAPIMVCAVPRVWRKCQNRNLCLLFVKFDPLWSQIDPLWSQSQPELSRLQDQNTKMSELSRLQYQNTKMSFPFKRFTTMPFTKYMYTFPMRCHYRQNSALPIFVNGAFILVNGAFIFVNGAFRFCKWCLSFL